MPAGARPASCRGRGAGGFPAGEVQRGGARCVLRWPAWPSTRLLVIGPRAAARPTLPGSGRNARGRCSCVGTSSGSRRNRCGAWVTRSMRRRRGRGPGPGNAAVPSLQSNRRARRRAAAHGQPASGRLAARSGRPSLAIADGMAIADRPARRPLLAAVLVKQLADRQLHVDAGVVEYLVNRMERSFAGARRWCGRWTVLRCGRAGL